MKRILCALLVVALYIPLYAHAETVLRTGENVAIDADQVVDGDYYVSVGPFGDTSMSGKVAGDMYALGGSVTTNGEIGGDATIIAGMAQVHSTTTDDVRIVSGEATIADHVGGDLFVIGGVLNVLSSAVIDGDVIFFGGNAAINGTVGGSILGTSKKIRVDAEVGGDVDVKTATTLTLGDSAVIEGSVRYASGEPLVRSQNASVAGEIVKNNYTVEAGGKTARELLLPLFVTLFAVLCVYLLFREELQKCVVQVQAHPLKSGVFGVAVLLLGPIVSILLIMTLLGSVIGIAGLALTVLAYVLGYTLCGVLLGAYLSKLFTKKLKVSLMTVVIGTCVVYALLFIPVLGSIMAMLLGALMIGGISLCLYKLLS